MLASLGPGEDPLPDAQVGLLSLSPYVAEGAGALWGVFPRDTGPVYKGSTPRTWHLPIVSASNRITWGGWVSHVNGNSHCAVIT